jgi:hypothetical protein
MKPKIVLVNGTIETTVATFSALNEAFQCAALLQALVNSQNYIYYVDYKHKGTLRRTQPDSFKTMVYASAHLLNFFAEIAK